MAQDIIVFILLCVQIISCLMAISLLIMIKTKFRPKLFMDDTSIYTTALVASLVTVLCGTFIQIILILL